MHTKIRIVVAAVLLLSIGGVMCRYLEEQLTKKIEAITAKKIDEFHSLILEKYDILKWTQEDVEEFDDTDQDISWEPLSEEELKCMDIKK